jgi:CHAD domain-containing protein
MSYRFRIRETVPAGIRRIALEQIDQALAQLTGPGNDPVRAVHNARMCFKRLRAVLRLVRNEIGTDLYKRENALYRDAGRRLSAVWHSAAKLRTLDQLVEQCDERPILDAAAGTRERLAREHRTTVCEMFEGQLLAEVATTLQEARTHVDTWPIEHDDFSTLMSGIWRVYKRGRKWDAFARGGFNDEDLHEWRKQVKYLWYHLRILRPCWSDMLCDLASSLQDLSDSLRDDRGLAELRFFLGDESFVLTGLIDQRRAGLRPAVRSLGQRVYAKEPALFAAHIADHWRAWRQSFPH